jgi:myosin heavy subunit
MEVLDERAAAGEGTGEEDQAQALLSKEGKGGDAHPPLDSTAFDALERDFQDVLSELVGDKSLERFRLEYEKLHRALKKSHEHEKRLIRKCRELNGEIVNNAAKVQTALKLSQEDQATIASLRKEIEKAWTMVDVAHDKEVRAKDTIQQLKEEIANLSKLVEKGAGLSVGQENMVKDLVRVRDELAGKVDDQQCLIQSLESKAADLISNNEALTADLNEKASMLAEARSTASGKEGELSRELRRRERMDRELKDLRSKLDTKTTEADEGSLEAARSQQKAVTLEKQLAEARATMEKVGAHTCVSAAPPPLFAMSSLTFGPLPCSTSETMIRFTIAPIA